MTDPVVEVDRLLAGITPGPWEVCEEDWATISSGSDSVIHGYYDDECPACGDEVKDDASVAISIEDARLHQGRLEAWGEPGHGACFRLTLPLVRGHKVTTSPLPLKPTGPKSVTALSSGELPAGESS